MYAGTTALGAFIIGSQLTVYNVGDSMAVLCTNGEAVSLFYLFPLRYCDVVLSRWKCRTLINQIEKMKAIEFCELMVGSQKKSK
jgi:hypothetical protein